MPPPLERYVSWLVAAYNLEAPELLYAAAYLKRLRRLHRRPKGIHRCTPYRLLLAAIMTAHKYLNDNSYTNVLWGRGFNLSRVEMDKVERAMLNLLGWKLRVSDEELQAVGWCPQDPTKYPLRHKKISLRRENAVIGAETYSSGGILVL